MESEVRLVHKSPMLQAQGNHNLSPKSNSQMGTGSMA